MWRQEIHPGAGYVTGWSMVMDYILNPLICTIGARNRRMTSHLRSQLGMEDFLRRGVYAAKHPGVKTSARINAGMAAGMGAVIVVIFVAAVRYIFGMRMPIPDSYAAFL